MLPALTTVRTPRAGIGSAATTMLLALLSGEAIASPCLDPGYQPMVREST